MQDERRPARHDAATRYRIGCPTAEGIRSGLRRVFADSQADSLWQWAIEGIATAEDDDDLTVTQLRAVCDRLAGKPGLVGVYGIAQRVRCDTWTAITGES